MASSTIILLLFLVSTISTTTSTNITTLLSPFPSFSSFNDLLSFTNLSREIDTLPSPFTLLVVNNNAVSAIAARPLPSLRRILSLHLLLDYYDQSHLLRLASSTSPPLLPTLLHSSGAAPGQMGFLRLSLHQADLLFTSAVDGGAPIRSKFVKKIAADKKYKYCILEVGAVVVPPGVTSIPFGSPPPAESPPGIDGRRRDRVAESIPPVAESSVPPPSALGYGSPPPVAAGVGSPGLLKEEKATSPSPGEGVSSGGGLIKPFFGGFVLLGVSAAAASIFL